MKITRTQNEYTKIKSIDETEIIKYISKFDADFRIDSINKENLEFRVSEPQLLEIYEKILFEEKDNQENFVTVLLKIFQKLFQKNIKIDAKNTKLSNVYKVELIPNDILIQVTCQNTDAKKAKICCVLYVLRYKFPIFIRMWIYTQAFPQTQIQSLQTDNNGQVPHERITNALAVTPSQNQSSSIHNDSNFNRSFTNNSLLTNVPNPKNYPNFSYGQSQIGIGENVNHSFSLNGISSIDAKHINQVKKTEKPTIIYQEQIVDQQILQDEQIFKELIKQTFQLEISYKINVYEAVSLIDYKTQSLELSLKSPVKYADILSKLIQKFLQKNMTLTFKENGDEKICVAEADSKLIFKIGIKDTVKIYVKEIAVAKYLQCCIPEIYFQVLAFFQIYPNSNVQEQKTKQNESILSGINPQLEMATFWTAFQSEFKFSFLQIEKDDLSNLKIENLDGILSIKLFNKDNFCMISKILSANNLSLKLTVWFNSHYEVLFNVDDGAKTYEVNLKIDAENTPIMVLAAEAKLIEFLFGDHFMLFISEFSLKVKIEEVLTKFCADWNIQIIDTQFNFANARILDLPNAAKIEKHFKLLAFSEALNEIFASNNQRISINNKTIEKEQDKIVCKIVFSWNDENIAGFIVKGQNEQKVVGLASLNLILSAFPSLVKFVPGFQ